MFKITVIKNYVRMLCRINIYTPKWVYKLNQYILTCHFFPTVGFYNEGCGFERDNRQNLNEWNNVIKVLQVWSKINNIDSVILFHSNQI